MVKHEVEVKVLEIDALALQRKLLDLGAKNIFDGIMRVQSYIPCDLKDVDYIRVRQEGPDCFLSVKKHLGGLSVKRTDEFSVKVGDFDQACELLEKLGFLGKRSYRKHRASLLLDDIQFEFDTFLDEYAFVPTFMEIEASSEAGVDRALKLLSIRKSAALSWTGGDIIRHYTKLRRNL